MKKILNNLNKKNLKLYFSVVILTFFLTFLIFKKDWCLGYLIDFYLICKNLFYSYSDPKKQESKESFIDYYKNKDYNKNSKEYTGYNNEFNSLYYRYILSLMLNRFKGKNKGSEIPKKDSIFDMFQEYLNKEKKDDSDS